MQRIIINDWEINPSAELLNTLEQIPEEDICPSKEHIFKALELVAPSEVKVIILGQDPYHSVDKKGNKKAMGLSFGINPAWIGERNYSSMAAIRAELYRADNRFPPAMGFDYSLIPWARQGVLLLNTSLTTLRGTPMAHANIGWRVVVGQIFEQITRPVLWMLWGSEAHKTAAPWIDYSMDKVICTSHPCKYSATRGKIPFIGSDCFRRANYALKELGHPEEINWTGLKDSE